MDLLIGVGLGLLTSLVGWWIVARALTPKLGLSADISKLPDEAGKAPWRYRVKVANLPRWWLPDWPTLDLRISASLRIKGLREKTTWSYFDVPIGFSGDVAYVDRNHIFRLRIYDISSERENFMLLPINVQHAIKGGDVTLEDLLCLGHRADLRVVMSAAHGYTQARRAVLRTYTLKNVVCGPFNRQGGRASVEVLEDRSRCEHDRERPSA
jgi:hypothetical protein